MYCNLTNMWPYLTSHQSQYNVWDGDGRQSYSSSQRLVTTHLDLCLDFVGLSIEQWQLDWVSYQLNGTTISWHNILDTWSWSVTRPAKSSWDTLYFNINHIYLWKLILSCYSIFIFYFFTVNISIFSFILYIIIVILIIFFNLIINHILFHCTKLKITLV